MPRLRVFPLMAVAALFLGTGLLASTSAQPGLLPPWGASGSTTWTSPTSTGNYAWGYDYECKTVPTHWGPYGYVVYERRCGWRPTSLGTGVIQTPGGGSCAISQAGIACSGPQGGGWAGPEAAGGTYATPVGSGFYQTSRYTPWGYPYRYASWI